ncbi:MAG: hypothetical protein JWP11_2264 [Frankiales bacterium]|nr:hypothetical protein [Frankiales bacterium]
MSDVKVLARWVGWCDPCETERPLVLTETGQRGLRAWLQGIGPDDRALTLTCGVCGEWQAVPHDEDDAPLETPVTARPVALQRLGARQVVVHAVAFAPYPIEMLAAPRPVTRLDPSDSVLELLSEGLDLISLAS